MPKKIVWGVIVDKKRIDINLSLVNPISYSYRLLAYKYVISLSAKYKIVSSMF
ncbi:hypothetical protein BH18THE2_BH18THE2_25330 [soil metagenome]